MRILFVDDERRRVRLYVQELEKNGHEVVFEDNPDAALKTLQDVSEHFDLLVLDVSLPPSETFKFADTRGGMQTGLPLYDNIRRLRPDLKIVALTNVSSSEVQNRFAQEDPRLCRLYIKPDTLPFRFAEKVREFLSDQQEG